MLNALLNVFLGLLLVFGSLLLMVLIISIIQTPFAMVQKKKAQKEFIKSLSGTIVELEKERKENNKKQRKTTKNKEEE